MGISQKLKNNSSIVLTVIHTFEAVIEQLSLTIEIMVKCSHAGPRNKNVNIFQCILIGKWELTLWNRITCIFIQA